MITVNTALRWCACTATIGAYVERIQTVSRQNGWTWRESFQRETVSITVPMAQGTIEVRSYSHSGLHRRGYAARIFPLDR